MPPHRATSLQPLLAFMRVGLLLLILLSPLPFGSVEPRSVLVLEIWAAVLGAAALVSLCREPELLSGRGRRLLLPASLLVSIGLVQLIPLPDRIVALFAPATAQARQALSAVLPDTVPRLNPISLSPPDTLDALLRLIAYILVGLAAAVCLRERRHIKMAFLAIVASGAFQALYGSVEYLSGNQHIFGYAKKYFLDSATGTFINVNHFAGYLAMTLPFALSAFMGRSGGSEENGWKARILRLAEPANLRLGFFALAAFLIVMGILLSYSRGGLAAALVGGLIVVITATRRRRTIAIVLLAFLIPAAFLFWQEVKAPGERLLAEIAELASLDSSRVQVWIAGVRMIPDFPTLGSGFGTFEEAFPVYQPPTARARWSHAHNDWLEAVIEGGPLTFLLVLWLFYLSIRGARSSRSATDSDPSPPLNAVIAGIAALAFHSLLDFSLRIPAVAILLSCLVGMTGSHYFQRHLGVVHLGAAAEIIQPRR